MTLSKTYQLRVCIYSWRFVRSRHRVRWRRTNLACKIELYSETFSLQRIYSYRFERDCRLMAPCSSITNRFRRKILVIVQMFNCCYSSFILKFLYCLLCLSTKVDLVWRGDGTHRWPLTLLLLRAHCRGKLIFGRMRHQILRQAHFSGVRRGTSTILEIAILTFLRYKHSCPALLALFCFSRNLTCGTNTFWATSRVLADTLCHSLNPVLMTSSATTSLLSGFRHAVAFVFKVARARPPPDLAILRNPLLTSNREMCDQPLTLALLTTLCATLVWLLVAMSRAGRVCFCAAVRVWTRDLHIVNSRVVADKGDCALKLQEASFSAELLNLPWMRLRKRSGSSQEKLVNEMALRSALWCLIRSLWSCLSKVAIV